VSFPIESDILDVRFIRWPVVVVLTAHPMPVSELLRHLSTMAKRELLQSDLTGRAKFVGANERLPSDERAEIDTREVLSTSWTHPRVRDVASRRTTVRSRLSRVNRPIWARPNGGHELRATR
jgi:hypothetical protein